MNEQQQKCVLLNDTFSIHKNTDSEEKTTKTTTIMKFMPRSKPNTFLLLVLLATLLTTSAAQLETSSMKETKFRQEFGAGREFQANELIIFERLLEGFTNEFSPETEAASKIRTSITFKNQNLRDNVLYLHYAAKYESGYYDVTEYPLLFQNYTNNHLDVLLEQLQLLNLNVTYVNGPKRILIQTPPPTVSSMPSAEPTKAPSYSPAPSQSPTQSPSSSAAPLGKIMANTIAITAVSAILVLLL